MSDFISNIRSKIREYFPSEIAFLLLVFTSLITLFVFIEISEAVIEGETRTIDHEILMLMRENPNGSEPIGPERFQYAVRDITSLGSTTILTLVTLFTLFFLYLKREIRSAIYVLSASIGGAVLVQILKFAFSRERPQIITPLVSEITMSFPSGHSAMSAVIYLSLAVLLLRVEQSNKYRIFIISSALIITFLVGLSRIYLGVHYPTDVIAGWMIGLFWALFCWIITYFFEGETNR